MTKKGKSIFFQTPRLNLIASEFSKPIISEKEKKDLERQSAQAMKELVIGHIRDQDLKWKKLSAKYLLEKAKKNQPIPGYWHATGELLKKIDVQYDGKVYYVGGAPGEIHEESGLEINHLISILEFGNYKSGIPARPLFRPSAKEFRKYIKTDLTDKVNEMMKKKWDSLMKKISK